MKILCREEIYYTW